jgi:ubiquinone/menaquinone biosynthesis C-methylase UbiE
MKNETTKEFGELKKEQWDAIDYGSWFLSKRGRVVDVFEKNSLLQAIQGKHYDTMLDVGIANGRQAETYYPFINKLVGIDISPKQLEYAKETTDKLKINAEFFVCSDASKLDFPDNSFDAIICTRVLQHVYDWKAALRDFHRVLKPGGDLYLLTYNRFSIYGIGKWLQHVFVNDKKGRFVNPINITRELKKSNFKIEYYAGALISQISAFPMFTIPMTKGLHSGLEKLCRTAPFKYLGERQTIRSKKI